MLGAFGFKQCEILRPGADAPAVAQAEPPELYCAVAAPGPQPHHQGAVEPVFRLDELQIEIAGTFLLILPQQVIGHFAVLTAEGIQPVGTQIAVQHEGNKALGGDGFARAVFAHQPHDRAGGNGQVQGPQLEIPILFLHAVQNDSFPCHVQPSHKRRSVSLTSS